MVSIDYSARLTLVQAAITTLLTNPVAEARDAEGNSVTYQDLDRLIREEERLVALINRKAAGATSRFRRGAMRA